MKKMSFVAVVVAGFALAGCSNQSPVAPASPAGSVSDTNARQSAAAPGIYDLSFNTWSGGTYQVVSSLAVDSDELILKAYVTNSLGAPATTGTVTFEYCSYKGGPPNDITRADEAPKEACEQGTASWARLTSMTVDSGRCPTLGTGYACMNFGIVHIPRDVGFRFRYASHGSSIASGMSASKNFTWVAGP